MLEGSDVAQGAVLAAPVVEVEVVLEPASPLGQRTAGYTVPELFLDGALDPFHLTVETWCPGSDAGVTYSQAIEKAGQFTAEFGTVVSLDTADGEGGLLEQLWQGTADSGGGAAFQDIPSRVAGAVVDEGELVAPLWQVLEVHLGPLPRPFLSVAGPHRLRLARPAHQGATAAQHSVDGAHAATDEAGLPQMGVEAAHSPPQLPVSVANGVQDLPRQGAGAAPWPPGTITQSLVALPLPAGPPAGGRGGRDLHG